MKKLLLLFFILFIFSLSIKAQIISFKELPGEIRESFSESYTKVYSPIWEKDKENYSVKFSVQNTQKLNIIYNECGQIIEKYMALPTKDAPEKIIDYLKKNHPYQSVKTYWIKQKGGERIYKVELIGNTVGKGSISGSSAGLSNPGHDKGDTTSVVYAENYQMELPDQLVYFDKNGNSITEEEGLAGAPIIKVADNTDLAAQNKSLNTSRRLKSNKRRGK